jgi:hypothetical protein
MGTPWNSDPKQILRRRADDKLAEEYLVNTAKTSNKILIYMGDLNVCNNVNDMSASPEFWRTEGERGVAPGQLPTDEKDNGFCGTTVNERTRMHKMMKNAQLSDPGANCTQFTWRGLGRYCGEGFRTDHILHSTAPTQHGLVKSHEIEGHSIEKLRFFGSNHCPVILKLNKNWSTILKGSKNRVVEEVLPHYKRKARARQELSKQYREEHKAMRKAKAKIFLSWITQQALLHLVAESPVMPSDSRAIFHDSSRRRGVTPRRRKD